MTNDTNLVSFKKGKKEKQLNLLNRDSDYALRALAYIAGKKGEPVSVKEITEELNIPRAFLRKSLQTLNLKGILFSKKGKNGGFTLARKASDISLKDVIEAFQGDFSLNECLLKKEICPERDRCILRKKIKKIEELVEKELQSTDIGSLMEGE